MTSRQWTGTPLRQVATVRVSNVDKKNTPGEVPVVLCNYTDVYANEYLTQDLPYMAASATRPEISRFALRRNDVVITKDSESPDDIGVPAVVTEDLAGVVCGYHLALLRPRRGAINPVYLAKQLGSAQSRRHFGVIAAGTTRFALPVSAVEEMAIPIAPDEEQGLIADVLTTLDKAIEETRALLLKRRMLRIGLMQDLLFRGVDGDGRVRSDDSHEFKDSELGRIPVDWEATTIGDQFALRSEPGRQGLPVMSVVMERGLVDRRDFDRRVVSSLPPEKHALVCAGDITYNTMRMWQGVLGRADFDCLVSPAYVVLRPRGSINTRFAEYLFRTERSVRQFRMASRGVVDDRLRLYPDDIFRVPIAIPRDPHEQAMIVERLDAIDGAIDNEAALLAKYTQLKAGLSEDLLTGRRRVTNLIERAGQAGVPR